MAVLRMAAIAGDSSVPRTRDLVPVLLQGLQGLAAEPPRVPTLATQDMAFHKFLAVGSEAVRAAAFSCYGLLGAACRAATTLRLWDAFPIANFCLPLLLMNQAATMEPYLAGSPAAAREMVARLDDLQEGTVEKLSELTKALPHIDPVGSSRLMAKPLGKLVRKYAEMFGVEAACLPRTLARQASTDLYYWVKQRYTPGEHSFTLTNWRDLLEVKVRGSAALQHQLVNNLFAFDICEARRWNDRLGLGYFEETEEEVEEWKGGGKTDVNSNVQDPQKEEEEEEEEELEKVEETCYKLTLPHDRIIMVDDKEKLYAFITDVEE